MNIKVTECGNCTFRHQEYDEWSTGKDMIETCMLKQHIDPSSSDYYIDMYYSSAEEKNLETPKWCPLKVDNVNITMDA